MKSSVALMFTLLLLSAPGAQSADINRVSEDFCTIRLTGEIVQGDAKKLEIINSSGLEGASPGASRQLGSKPERPTLCLDSPGGSFSEALDIIAAFPDRMRTAVENGRECLSACALVFLAGRLPEGFPTPPRPDRWMSVGARLGFHAPFIPVEVAGARAYSAGVRAVALLLDQASNDEGGRPLFPISLLAEFLKLEPSKFFEIDRIYQALEWDIGILDLPYASTLDRCRIARACLNYVWVNEVGVDLQEGESGSEGGLFSNVPLDLVMRLRREDLKKSTPLSSKKTVRYQYKLSLGRRGEFYCAIYLFRLMSGRILIDIDYNNEGKFDPVNDKKLENLFDFMDLLAMESSGYLFNPALQLSRLSSENADPGACAADEE